MLVAGTIVAAVGLAGGLGGYLWARSQRGKPVDAASPAGKLLGRIRAAGDASAQADRARMSSFGLVLAGLGLFALLNLIAFMAESLWIGGDAGAGTEIDGRFFVSSHGHLTEVSAGTFAFSLWHGRSVWVSMVLLFAIALLARAKPHLLR